MPFQFTVQELAQLDSLQVQARQLGRYDAVYRRIRDIVAARGGYPSAEPIDVAQSRRWFAGAEQSNAGEGIFSAFLRAYSTREYVLHYASNAGALMQVASNRVAENAITDIFDTNGALPGIDRIAERDATGVGAILFDRDRNDTAFTNNAAWAGTLLFSALGSDQTYRLIGVDRNAVFDILDDLRNVMFAYDAFRATARQLAGPAALAYLTGLSIGPVTYSSIQEAEHNNLASSLFQIEGVKQVHFFQNVITLTHQFDYDSDKIQEQACSVIQTRMAVHNPDQTPVDEKKISRTIVLHKNVIFYVI